MTIPQGSQPQGSLNSATGDHAGLGTAVLLETVDEVSGVKCCGRLCRMTKIAVPLLAWALSLAIVATAVAWTLGGEYVSQALVVGTLVLIACLSGDRLTTWMVGTEKLTPAAIFAGMTLRLVLVLAVLAVCVSAIGWHRQLVGITSIMTYLPLLACEVWSLRSLATERFVVESPRAC